MRVDPAIGFHDRAFCVAGAARATDADVSLTLFWSSLMDMIVRAVDVGYGVTKYVTGISGDEIP